MHKKRTFLHDAIEIAAMGSHALESDDFSKCFRAVELPNRSWSTSKILSVFIRHCVLFPLRVCFCFFGFCAMAVVFMFAEYFQIQCLINKMFFAYMKLFVICLNIHLRHYGDKRRLKEPAVYVSNHTSFIDFIVLSSYKFHHACVAEHHGGLFGFIFDFLISKNGSISFKRSEKKDKQSVIKKISEHIQKNQAPMLIFPEGTCVNNKYSVLFQKGAFELNALICPVAISYKKTLVDPYWNRRKHGFVRHLLYLLTRWRIDADVYWMGPVRRREEEDSIEFGHRVKKMIADKINLKNKAWNGYFKSQPMQADAEIFRKNFKTVYQNIKAGKLELQEDREHPFAKYYQSKDSDENEKKYFGKLSYEEFTNECCKEYLKIKALSHNDREALINAMAINESKAALQKKGVKIVPCGCNSHK